jgi:hypothetical protein
MVDPAAMYLVIANAAMHRKALRPRREDDLIELSHNSAALTSINQRIRDSNWNVTDEMLGAILGVCKNIFE